MTVYFIRSLTAYKGWFFFLVIISALGGLLELVFPLGVRDLLEEGVFLQSWPVLFRKIGFLALVEGAVFLFSLLGSYYGGKLSARVENDLRMTLFRHLTHLSFAFFDYSRTGKLMATLMGDISEAGDLVSRIPGDFAVSLVTAVGTIILLLYLNRPLGLVVIVLMAFKVVHTIVISGKLRNQYGRNRREFGHLSALGEENLSGIRMIRAYSAEHHIIEAFQKVADAYLRAREQTFFLGAYFGSSISLFTHLIQFAILLMGVFEIRRGAMTIADLVAYFLYVGVFIKPAMKLVFFVEAYQKSMAGFRRFYELIRVEEESGKNLPPLEAPHGTIEFRHVSFHYKGLPDVLHDLSFTIRKGETIAFVGETGSGKTTLLSLLLRFYDPTKGHIYLDGKDVADYSRDSIRKAIAFVSQDVFLFSGTIAENIAYGNLFAGMEAVQKAAERAHAASFIGRFPQSYDTAVGQRGVRLSGGQRQRIALARAFLRASPILILDEATSALDNVTEAQVQRAMESLQRGRTTLIVAHRLSTIRHADRIFVMKRGRIAEEGTLENLIEKKGLFWKLWTKEQNQPQPKRRNRSRQHLGKKG